MSENASSMDDYAAARESGAPAEVAVAAVPATTPEPSAASDGMQNRANSGDAPQTNDQPAEPGAEPKQPTPEELQQRQRRRSGVQKRFDELTQRAIDAERRADLLLESYLSKDKGAQERPNAAPPADQAPKEEDYPGDYRAFLRAEAQYTARTEARQLAQQAREEANAAAETQRQEANTRQQVEQVGAVVTQFADRNEAFAQNVGDYDATVSSLDAIEIGPHNAAMVQTLLMRPDSGQILYAFGKNPRAAAEISRMPPALQGAALGEFAAHIARAPRPSDAPPPGRPVGVRAPSAGGLAVSGSMDDYAASRRR